MKFIHRFLLPIFLLSIVLNSLDASAQTKTKKKQPKQSVRDELLSITPAVEKKKHVEEELDVEPSVPANTTVTLSTSTESNIPLYFWQAEQGRFAITPFGEAAYLRYEGTFITGSPGGQKYKVSAQTYRFGSELEYGIWKHLSIGAGISYMAQVTDEDVSTTNGIEDIAFFAKSFYALSSMNLHYGIRFGISPSNHVDDNQGNKNTFSGGNSYAPYFGLSKRTGSGIFGFQLTYAYKDTRITDYDYRGNALAVKGSLTGGHIFSGFGFYERKSSATWNMGFAAGYMGESSKQFRDSTSPTVNEQNGESYFVGQAYFPYNYSAGMLLIPRVEFQSFLNNQLGTRTLDSKWAALLRLDIRF